MPASPAARPRRRPILWVIATIITLIIALITVWLLPREDESGQRSTPVLVGVSQPNTPHDPEAVTAFESYGRTPDFLLWFHDFRSRISPSAVAAIPDGVTPVITWEPFHADGDAEQPDFTLRSIYQGAHDALLEDWAHDLAALDRPVILRFAHEMNGNWYPWSEQANGNAPGDYVRAWNHVQDLFRARGAGDVEWMWSPNVVDPGSIPLEDLYPGDDRVDWIGLDGYNFGTATEGMRWIWPEEVFEETVDELSLLSDRPLVIAEVGSAEEGGSKTEWITRFGDYLLETPEIDGFIWFDHDLGMGLDIASSAGAEEAFGRMLQKLPAP